MCPLVPPYERYVNFYTDFAFKKLFGTEVNKELLISFLNALLHGQETVKDLTYLNAEQLGTQEYDRRAVFDVYCINEQGERFIVEMQKGEQQFFKDRSIYYSTFAIREQAPKGEWDYQLKGVYTICILNFKFDDTDPTEYFHEVKLVDTRSKRVFYDKLTFIYLEMPKFTKEESDLKTLFDKWLYAIRRLGELMERPQALRDRVFTRLFEQAEIAKFNPNERYEYEDSLKVYRDWTNVLHTAEIKGEKRGERRGRKKGREEGRKEGIEEGRKNTLLEMAAKLKAQGMNTEEIASLTGLSKEEI